MIFHFRLTGQAERERHTRKGKIVDTKWTENTTIK